MRNRLTDLLKIQYPIIEGGLAHLGDAYLAASISNAGGLGQITAMTLSSSEELREEIQKIKELTELPFGVNIAISQHNNDWKEYLKIIISEQVPIISISGGNPKPILDELQGVDIKKISLVSTVKQAKKAESIGIDAVIAIGQEAGGHIGVDDLSTLVLVPSIVDAINIPVIAGGGFADGRGFMAALALGAEGIQMGTRFIATKECQLAHGNYKKALIDKTELDTIVIKRSLNQPARAFVNETTLKINQLEKSGANFDELKGMIDSNSNKKAIYEGDMEEGFAWVGQAVGLIDDIPSVKDLFLRIIGEAEEISEKWKNIF